MLKTINIIAILGLLFLVGCAPMEKRSDMPDKKNLSSISQPIHFKQKWQADTGSGVGKFDVKLNAVRHDDKLYTADASGKVTAIDAERGFIVWNSDVQASISAGPAVGDGKVVVGTRDGKIIALDLQGKPTWTSSTSSEILASPLITNGMVLVHTMDGGLSSFSTVDGRQLWRFSHNLPPLMLRRSSTPVAVGDKIVAGFANGKVLSMRKVDGTVEWSYDVAAPKGRTDLQRMGDISADPVVRNGVVYVVGYQGNLVAIRQDNGQMLWDRNVGSFSGLVITNDMIFLSDPIGDIYALDINNGNDYWVQTDLEGRRLSKPAVMDDYVIVGDDDGILHLLDRNNGARVGSYSVGGKGVESAPIVNDDTVYVLGRSGKLVALEVR